MNLQATQIRVGMIIIHEKALFKVTAINHLTPGNKRGQVHVKMKRIKDGISFEKRFRSDDTVERVSLEQKNMEYLYSQDSQYYFMDSETFDQIPIDEEMLGEDAKYLLPNTHVKVEFFEADPLGISLPKTVELKVVSTEASLRGATASASYKPAKLETGLSVSVPPFIKEGDIIRIDTGTGKYLERVTK